MDAFCDWVIFFPSTLQTETLLLSHTKGPITCNDTNSAITLSNMLTLKYLKHETSTLPHFDTHPNCRTDGYSKSWSTKSQENPIPLSSLELGKLMQQVSSPTSNLRMNPIVIIRCSKHLYLPTTGKTRNKLQILLVWGTGTAEIKNI